MKKIKIYVYIKYLLYQLQVSMRTNETCKVSRNKELLSWT